jgi:hypothetical protein
MQEEHELDLRHSGAGLTIGECACGEWWMKLGPDALIGQAGSLDELVEERFESHVDEAS